MFKVIFGGLSAALAPFLVRIFAVGGFAFFSEAIFRGYLTKMQQLALSHLSSIPSQYQQLIYMTGINDAISIIFSAFFMGLIIIAAKAIASAKASRYSEPHNGF